MRPRPLPCVVLAALPAAAVAGELDGEWCQDGKGPVMFWEERSLGYGEHTICDWQDPPAGRTAFQTTIHCASIYLNGEEVIRMNPQSHAFKARLLAGDRLEVQFNDDPPVELDRCDF